MASLIAAHAADITRGIDVDRDLAMARARKALDWERMFELSLDSERARTVRAACNPEDEEACSMCGDLCALKMVEDALERKGD